MEKELILYSHKEHSVIITNKTAVVKHYAEIQN